jgi:phosphoadenosine phosphosulfate reductase
MDNTIAKHERIALQFSVGKDSLAMLHLMRKHWDRLTVYWVNTGDAFPESLEAVERVRAMVPHFVEIDGNQPQVIAQFGIPSDIVPVSATPIGMANGGAVLMQDRYSCCMRTVMLPLAQRMVEDGITLIVRGQKECDANKAPLRSGDVDEGIEYLFPLEDWSDEDVMTFLEEEGVELPRYYESMRSNPPCLSCSAWWDDGRAAYLKKHHPIHYDVYQQRLNAISHAVGGHIAAFNIEVSDDGRNTGSQ